MITLRESFANFGMNELLRWIIDRELPMLFERSLRLQPGILEARRCLFSFPTPALGASADAEVLQICRLMSSPERQLHAIQRFFRGAHHVHFGFEYSGDTVIGKCYLELDESGSGDAKLSRLKFLGFKWSMNDASVAVVSRYRTLSPTAWDELSRTMRQNISSDVHPGLVELLNEFQPSQQIALPDLNLLEVEEEGSDRRSHDLNVYAHERTVWEVSEAIKKVGELLKCDQSRLLSFLKAHSDAIVGHVAIGQSRTGQPFVTIYHAADVNVVLRG